jgi:hypothetical protein
MPCLSSNEYSEDISYQKFIEEKQMLDIDTVISMRPLSSFTQASFESDKVYMANDLILFICFYALLCSESCTKNASIP